MRARDLNPNFRTRSRSARVNGGQRGSGDDRIAGHQIQDHLKPPSRLVANLDGDGTQRSFGAQENGEGDLFAGELVARNEVELQEMVVSGVKQGGFVRGMQLDRERGDRRSALEGQSVFLRVMNVAAGQRSGLAGEGEVGPGGGPPGDLFLEIVQRPHPIFERQGDDLHCTVTIPMVAAALGATLSVESLDGPADIDIRPGTQSGQAIPLYGQGVKHLNGNGRGDLVIHVTVETPAKLDAEQEKLLRDLAKLRGEEAPPGKFAPGQQGFFSRLRDAFNGR